MSFPTVVDIFCGAGGISRGFQDAGFEVLLGIDIDEYAVKIFNKQFPQAKTIVGDIREIDYSKIKKIIGRRKIDVLVGGPPCQGFSLAGKRKLDDRRNTLFYEFVRLAKEIKPSWILLENVIGLASAKMPDGTNAIDAIYNAMSPEFQMKHFFVNAADFGIPQKRKRIIFVGNSGKVDFEFRIPKLKWKPVSSIISDSDTVGQNYFYSERLIRGFVKREKLNKKRGLGFRWQFLKMDQPSYTIPARYWKDGSNAVVKYSTKKMRKLTEEECARIQGLDPKLFSNGKKNYVAIGNAVPPKLIQPFAQKILLHITQ